jgi:arylsulfatase A-like enzyme
MRSVWQSLDIEEAIRKPLDDNVGYVLKKLDDMGQADNS